MFDLEVLNNKIFDRMSESLNEPPVAPKVTTLSTTELNQALRAKTKILLEDENTKLLADAEGSSKILTNSACWFHQSKRVYIYI